MIMSGSTHSKWADLIKYLASRSRFPLPCFHCGPYIIIPLYYKGRGNTVYLHPGDFPSLDWGCEAGLQSERGQAEKLQDQEGGVKKDDNMGAWYAKEEQVLSLVCQKLLSNIKIYSKNVNKMVYYFDLLGMIRYILVVGGGAGRVCGGDGVALVGWGLWIEI